MLSPIVRKFHLQGRQLNAANPHRVEAAAPVVSVAWVPDTNLQDLQSHCEVKELSDAEGEKAWHESQFVQDFIVSFEDTAPSRL
jgi:hypothetical protein